MIYFKDLKKGHPSKKKPAKSPGDLFYAAESF